MKQCLGVVARQKRDEARQAAQVKPTVAKRLEHGGVLASRARDGDPAIRLGLREMQGLGAVGEHRREGSTGEEPPLVDLADVSDQLRLDALRPSDEVGEAAE